MVETMQAVKAAIGGEGSNGGIIFPAVHLCRDSYTGMAFLLGPHGGDGPDGHRDWRRKLPTYHRKLGKVAFEHGRLGPLMQALEENFPARRCDRSDGLKLMLPGRVDPRAGVEHRADPAAGGGGEDPGGDGRSLQHRDGTARAGLIAGEIGPAFVLAFGEVLLREAGESGIELLLLEIIASSPQMLQGVLITPFAEGNFRFRIRPTPTMPICSVLAMMLFALVE